MLSRRVLTESSQAEFSKRDLFERVGKESYEKSSHREERVLKEGSLSEFSERGLQESSQRDFSEGVGKESS